MVLVVDRAQVNPYDCNIAVTFSEKKKKKRKMFKKMSHAQS